ncbi:AAA family ATPase [Thermodesulfobacteriota bacterium]
MAVLTISRQIGSRGAYIGQKVAESLDYHCADKAVMEKVFVQYGFISFEKIYDTEPRFWDRFDEMRASTIHNLNEVIKALAHHGDSVIIGRGSFAVLGGFADVLNVRIHAPFHVRVQRVMDEMKIDSIKKAEALVKEKDKKRAGFVESSYHVRFRSSDNFDLAINTGTVPPDLAVAWLVEAVKTLDEMVITDKPTIQSIQADRVISKAVSTALGCKVIHGVSEQAVAA